MFFFYHSFDIRNCIHIGDFDAVENQLHHVSQKLYWIEISLMQWKLPITLLDMCEASDAFLSSIFWNRVSAQVEPTFLATLFTFFRFRPLPPPSLEHPGLYPNHHGFNSSFSPRDNLQIMHTRWETFKICDKASEQVEVNCDAQPPPENLTQPRENRIISNSWGTNSLNMNVVTMPTSTPHSYRV